jgi:N-acetylmuramoyl-L-alanine amidase
MAEYVRAESLQRRLNARPIAERTRVDYERALDAYRAVYHGDPASPDAARSVAAVADLLTSEGRAFHDSRLLHDAVAQWNFLCSQYPGSPLRRRAKVEIAEIVRHPRERQAMAPQNRNESTSPAQISGLNYAKKQNEILAAPQTISRPKDSPQIASNTVQFTAADSVQKKPVSTGVHFRTLDNAVPPEPAILQSVRYWAVGKSTRIAIDLSSAAPYRVYPAPDHRQITLLFFGAHPAGSLLETIAFQQDTNVGSAHILRLTGDQTEVVLQLLRPLPFTYFTLTNPQRVILDVSGQPPRAQNMVSANLPAPTISARPVPPPANPAPDGQHSLTRVLGLRVRRIVIDAGHGGHDSGTLGPGGLQEKDIALDVALRLGQLLRQRMGADVIYTRRTDIFVPLEQRTALANRAHADLFLSIHANSSADPDARGVETYFLNFTASPAALAVAARENAVSNRSVYELSDLVRRITLSDKIDESRQFAADVQQSLYSGLAAGNTGLKDRGVKQAPFVVLIGAHMPSILAEISFLTNPTDASELAEPAYRERLAEALYRGVAGYVDGMSGVRVAKTVPAKMMTDRAE